MQITFQTINTQQSQFHAFMNAKYKIEQIDYQIDTQIYTGAISNNLKYIIAGGSDKVLKIWKYQTNALIKSLKFDDLVMSCNFTDDSHFLFVGGYKFLYQFSLKNQFKKIFKYQIHNGFICDIYCISNSQILTFGHKNIIKSDLILKQQLLKIQAHDDNINGFDYTNNLNMIVSGSEDQSIKLWDVNDGSLVIQKLNAHNNKKSIQQVLFIIKSNQLISLDECCILIIWIINYEYKKLDQLKILEDSGCNTSLVFQQQYIISTGKQFIKVYTVNGQFVRQFDHHVNDFLFFNTIQLDSMKALLIQGNSKLLIYKLDMD